MKQLFNENFFNFLFGFLAILGVSFLILFATFVYVEDDQPAPQQPITDVYVGSV